MSLAFVNGWKRYYVDYNNSWARSVKLVEFSIFHLEKKTISVRIALFGFVIEVTI